MVYPAEYERSLTASILHDQRGLYPFGYDHILVPYHLNGDHWIAVAIGIDARCIYLFDSLADTGHHESVLKASPRNSNRLYVLVGYSLIAWSTS